MITRARLLSLFAIALLSGSAISHANPEVFAGEISEFGVRDQVRMPKPCGVVFIGSSSIKLWVGLERDFSDYNIIQRGFGGSQISDSNHYFDVLVAKYKPAKIVFYAGENDLNAGEDVDAVYQDFLTFMAKKDAVLGATPVYFIAAKPSPSRAAQKERQAAFNAKVEALAETRADLVYIDVVTPMLDAQGVVRDDIFIADKLHMNEKGYAIWRTVISDAMEREMVIASPQCPAQ